MGGWAEPTPKELCLRVYTTPFGVVRIRKRLKGVFRAWLGDPGVLNLAIEV